MKLSEINFNGTPPQVSPHFLIDEEVLAMVRANCPVLFSVSGGKDGATAALETSKVLDELGHQGPRYLIHSDLGSIEWVESLLMCQNLAAHLGLELLVVEREKGGMVEQWHQRWESVCQRYANLEMVAMIGPWSSAKWRFCTKSQKIAPISQEAVKLFPGKQILSVVGLRREESGERAKKPISHRDENLERANGTRGRAYYPVLDYLVEDVLLAHMRAGFPRHRAYTEFGSHRVSCMLCVLASLHDLLAALQNPASHPVYRVLVELEALSTFSFQPQRWLGDLRPELLGEELRTRFEIAKFAAARRREIEKRIPKVMRYVRGWPTFQPSMEQCELLAEVRAEVAATIGIAVNYTSAEAVYGRYAELLEKKALKEAALRAKEERARRKRQLKSPDEGLWKGPVAGEEEAELQVA